MFSHNYNHRNRQAEEAAINNFQKFVKADAYSQIKIIRLLTEYYKILNTWNNVKADFFGTFRKYSGLEFVDDLAQPFYGIANILKGLFNIVDLPFVALIFLVGDLFKSASAKDYFTTQVPLSIANVTTTLGVCVISLLRGLTQIAATPLMLLNVLFRGLLTSFSSRSEPNHEYSLPNSSHQMMFSSALGVPPSRLNNGLTPSSIQHHSPLFPSPSSRDINADASPNMTPRR